MKKIITSVLVLLIISFLLPLQAVSAQEDIIMVPSTMPVDGDLFDDVVAYLGEYPPADTNIYVITAVSTLDGKFAVSVAGLRPDLPAPYVWGLEDGDAIWTGSILIGQDGTGELFQPGGGGKGARPVPPPLRALPGGGYAPGGGPEIALPWKGGTKMMYGIRAIHGSGDYGTSGMYAVDWVGGDDMGADVAPPIVYGSYGGTIDYVCTDGTSVAVRATDGSNVFVYAHLIAGTDLEVGDTITKGAPFGTLKYGSFDDTCGWAIQQADHYHIHWMFDPDGGYYQAEGWILYFSDNRWHNGTNSIGVGGYVTGGGGSGDWYIDDDDPSTLPPIVIDPNDPGGLQLNGGRFWDYALMGLNDFVEFILSPLPDHGDTGGQIVDPNLIVRKRTAPREIYNTIINVAKPLIDLVYGGFVGLLNFVTVLFIISVWLVSELVYFIYAMWRFVLKIVPMAN